MSEPVFVWPLLYRGVIAQFAADSLVCENGFGWREPTLNPKAPGVRKISWVPGDPVGDAGKWLPPVQVEGSPKSLATLEELLTVYIFAADVSDPTELGQYTAVRKLYDQWFRAIYLAAYSVGTGGRFAAVKHTWDTTKKERVHGACLRVLCSAQAQIPDVPYTYAPTDAVATLDGMLSITSDGAPLGGIVEQQTITKADT